MQENTEPNSIYSRDHIALKSDRRQRLSCEHFSKTAQTRIVHDLYQDMGDNEGDDYVSIITKAPRKQESSSLYQRDRYLCSGLFGGHILWRPHSQEKFLGPSMPSFSPITII
jgi:hypothetical protein